MQSAGPAQSNICRYYKRANQGTEGVTVGCSRGFACRFVHCDPESSDELQLYYRMQTEPEIVIRELGIK